MQREKKELISIKGLMAKWKVSHMTIYRNYLPRLKKYKIKGKVYVDWQKAQELHNEISQKYEIIA